MRAICWPRRQTGGPGLQHFQRLPKLQHRPDMSLPGRPAGARIGMGCWRAAPPACLQQSGMAVTHQAALILQSGAVGESSARRLAAPGPAARSPLGALPQASLALRCGMLLTRHVPSPACGRDSKQQPGAGSPLYRLTTSPCQCAGRPLAPPAAAQCLPSRWPLPTICIDEPRLKP